MRPRRFPRKPIDPKFKIAIAFQLPIDIVIGLGELDTYGTSDWILKRAGILVPQDPAELIERLRAQGAPIEPKS